MGYSGGWQRGGGGGDWSLGGRRPGGRGSHGGAWRGGGSNRGRSLGGREQHPYHHRQQQREQLQADRVDFSRRISAEYSRYKSTDGRRDGRSGGGGSRGATDGRADENKRGQSASSSSSSSSDSGTGQQNGYQQHYAPPAGGRGRGRGSGGRGQRSQHQYLDVDSGATADEEGRSCNDRFKSPSPDRTGGKRPAPESFLVPANERPAARSRASPEHQSEDICIGQARGDGDAGAGGGGDGTGEEARIMRRKARKEKKNKDLSQSSEHKDDDTHRSRDKKLKQLRALEKRASVAQAEGESLAKQVARNTLVQQELEIQIDAAKRTLALYSSLAGAAAPIATEAESPRSADVNITDDDDDNSERDTTAAVSMMPPAQGRSSGSSTTSSSRGAHDNPDVGAAAPSRTPSSAQSSSGGRSPASLATSAAVATPTTAAAAAAEVSPMSTPTTGISAMPPTKVGNNRTVAAAAAAAATATATATASTSTSSTGAVDAPRRVRTRPSPPLETTTTDDTPRRVRAPPPLPPLPPPTPPFSPTTSSGVGDDFPSRVPNDVAATGSIRSARGVPNAQAVAAAAAGDEERIAPAASSGSRTPQSVGERAAAAAAATGVAAAIGAPGSFDVRKQIMFQTTRTYKARSMTFNPTDKDVFAVCSSDLSLDLWRYTRHPNHELEKLGELDQATPNPAGHMAWNPSGTCLAIGHSGPILMDNWAATIIHKEGLRRTKLRSLKHTKPAQAVAWVKPSKNNQDHLVTGGDDGAVVIWTRVLDPKSDLHKVAVLHNKHTSAVRSACCPSISPTVVTGGADGRLVNYSIETASVQWDQLLRVSKEYHPAVNQLLEFPDNPYCLLVSAVDTARSHSMFTMDTRQPPSMMHSARKMEWKRRDESKPFSSNVYPTLSPCGRYVACAGDWNGCFHLWDVRAGGPEPMQSVIVNNSARIAHTAWHPDGQARALMSLSAGHGAATKHFALHLHAGLRH